MKYEVYHRDTLEGISYHDTILEALGAIKMYEEVDRTDGVFTEDAYDWRIDIEGEED